MNKTGITALMMAASSIVIPVTNENIYMEIKQVS